MVQRRSCRDKRSDFRAIALVHSSLTWFIGYFAIEGVIRMLAPHLPEQIFGTLPLAFVDWCYGKATGRPLEGDALHVPSGKVQVQSFVSAVREQECGMARSPEVEDELVGNATGAENRFWRFILRGPRAEWIPPRS